MENYDPKTDLVCHKCSYKPQPHENEESGNLCDKCHEGIFVSRGFKEITEIKKERGLY